MVVQFCPAIRKREFCINNPKILKSPSRCGFHGRNRVCKEGAGVYQRVVKDESGFVINEPGVVREEPGAVLEKLGLVNEPGVVKVINHFLRHDNIKCLDTIPLNKNYIC